MCNIDYKKSIIESTLTSAKLFHDDRLDTIEPTTTPSPPPPTAAEIPTHASSSSLSNLKKRFSSSSSTSSSRKKKSDRHSVTEILKIKEDTDPTTINNNESSSSLSQHNYVNQDLTIAESDDYEQEDFDDEFNIISNKNLTQHEIGRKH